MVATIAAIKSDYGDYLGELANDDYYSHGGEPPGVWLGTGAAALGLKGKIQGGQLDFLLRGFTPDGKALVKNSGKDNRQPGWDMVFTPPKSVSVLWGIAPPKIRKIIQDIHEKAVAETVDHLEENALWTRRDSQGKAVERAKAVVASYLHGTSRDGDPNLHTHCVFANACVRDDGSTGAIASQHLYRHKMVSGALCRAKVSRGLRKVLGLDLKQTKTWFEVKGVSKAVRDEFSKRRLAIVALVGKNASQRSLDIAALQTRQVKKHIAQELLIPYWKTAAAKLGLATKAFTALFNRPQRELDVTAQSTIAKEAVAQSIREIVMHKSYFCRKDILRGALEKIQDGKTDFKYVEDAVEQSISNLKFLGQDKTQTYYTTHELYAKEKECLAIAEKMLNSSAHTVSRKTVNSVLSPSIVRKAVRTVLATIDDFAFEVTRNHFKTPDFSFLSNEQRKAVDYLTSQKGALKVLSGRAGSGKTTILSAARECWERSGKKVVGTALSGRAAQELAKGAGINSETIRMRLTRLNPNWKRTVGHHAKQLALAAMNKETYPIDRFKLDRNTVLVIDEASMVGTEDLNQLMVHANKAKAMVVIVGDQRQTPSISAGTPFQSLHEISDGYALHDNVRQETAWLKEATNLFADGQRRDALTKFADEGRLRFEDSKDAAMKGLLRDWRQHRTEDLADSICIAETNADVTEINRRIQDYRRKKGELGEKCFAWNRCNFRAGDRISFHENDRKLGVWNGDLGTVRDIKGIRKHLVVELDSGKTITFLPKEYGESAELTLGYATTVHKSQSATFDKSFVFMGDNGLTSSESAYVSLTRARFDTFINTYGPHGAYEDVLSQQEIVNEVSKRVDKSVAKHLAHQLEQRLQVNQ